MTRPLEGVRIVEVATMILGPLATQYLADLGADVIKIESPEGDLTRVIGPRRSPKMGAFFLSSNRNKRSVVLDLKAPQAREVLDTLVKSSDGILHSIRKGAAERIGLSYARLSAVNPKIIYCHVKGFSDDGLYGGKPAYDDIAQAQSGLAVLQAIFTGEPRYVPTIVADKVGALHAALAVLGAVFHAGRTGVGQEVDVPMFETMVAFNMVENIWGQVFEPPLGKMGYGPLVQGTRRPYKTSDGGYISIVPYTDEHWRRFCIIADDANLTSNPLFSSHAARQANHVAFWTEVGVQIARRPKAEWIQALGAVEVPFGEALAFDDLLEEPHLNSIGFWKSVAHPTEGLLRMPAIPYNMSATPLDVYGPCPGLGEHNSEVLQSVGYGADAIHRLAKAGVFGPSGLS